MSDEFKSNVERAANSAAYSAQQAGNALQQGAQEVGASVQKTASEVVDIMSEGAKDVSSNLTDAASQASAAAAEGTQKAAEAGKTNVDELVGEFNRVGNQVADSARSIWESEERKDLQDAVVKTLTSIAAAIEEQFKKIADKDETRKLVGKLEETTDKVVENVKSSKTAQDAGEGILKALQSAAASIEKWLSQQKSEAPPAESAPVPPAAPSTDGEDIFITKSE